MKVSRKTFQIISLMLVSASMLLIVLYNFNSNVTRGGETPPQNNPSDLPEEPQELVNPETPPQFVVPESSLGTLGLVGAFAAAFGMFAIAHKRK